MGVKKDNQGGYERSQWKVTLKSRERRKSGGMTLPNGRKVNGKFFRKDWNLCMSSVSEVSKWEVEWKEMIRSEHMKANICVIGNKAAETFYSGFRKSKKIIKTFKYLLAPQWLFFIPSLPY